MATVPDLDALLSAAAARQALTPAARAHSHRGTGSTVGDPRIALFSAGNDAQRIPGARFAIIAEMPVNRGQSS